MAIRKVALELIGQMAYESVAQVAISVTTNGDGEDKRFEWVRRRN
jgi:hypothetical protein